MLLRQGLGTFERQGGAGPAVLATFECQVSPGPAVLSIFERQIGPGPAVLSTFGRQVDPGPVVLGTFAHQVGPGTMVLEPGQFWVLRQGWAIGRRSGAKISSRALRQSEAFLLLYFLPLLS